MDRREFLAVTALAPVALQAAPFEGAELLGKLAKETGPAPLAGATWYTATELGDGLRFLIPAGHLKQFSHLTCDMLLDGVHLACWEITLREGERGRAFRFAFGALNQCSLRMRMALALVDQNRWMVEREGAFLKPRCAGDRVELEKVDRIEFRLNKKGPAAVRWCMTPLAAVAAAPERLMKPLLTKGPLVDEMGQSTLTNWPGKTRSLDEMKQRLLAQRKAVPTLQWPEGFSEWGGSKARKLGEATGFFRVHHDGKRWWLVDPAGYAFWSTGADCVRVDTDARIDGIEDALTWKPAPNDPLAACLRATALSRGTGSYINYLSANCMRAFGVEGWREEWARIALGELKRLRFNTVGNWSEWEYAAKAKTPYVRPMSFRGARTPMIYRDFPDVYGKGFELDAADYAAQLKSTATDPAFLGYFLMNEPTWGFSSELPAAGMLYNSDAAASRDELARFLRAKYDGDAALAAAWKLPASFEKVTKGRWSGVLTPEALGDLRAFSVKMVERYFTTLSAATKTADPNHLNLGMRWAGVPPVWAVEGMKTFDVFSINCYMNTLPRAQAEKIHAMVGRPVLVGEWHFGALDVGLPASGIGHLKNQAERAKAYRVYLEDAAANPFCVGVHWFTLYDQSALGRFDGENYNIGFLDVCHKAYTEMSAAAILSHERMYEVAAGTAQPFTAQLEYLPRLYL